MQFRLLHNKWKLGLDERWSHLIDWLLRENLPVFHPSEMLHYISTLCVKGVSVNDWQHPAVKLDSANRGKKFSPAVCLERCRAKLFLRTINSVCFPHPSFFYILNSYLNHFLLCVNSALTHLCTGKFCQQKVFHFGSLWDPVPDLVLWEKSASVLNVMQHWDQKQRWWQCNILMSRLWRKHDRCI